MKTLIRRVMLLAAFVSGSGHASDAAEQLRDKMLAQLGGKESWAKLTSTINGSIQNRIAAPNEVYSVITMDFTRARFKIETTAEDIYLIRVINGDQSWRISWGGEIEDLPQASYEQDMLWYQAHIYRTIHRLAKKDPRLSVRLVENRLEVIEGRQRLVWLKLDSRGEPYAFGFRDDDQGSLCGPWTMIKDGIRHPRWVSHADGSWRAAIQALDFNVPLHDSLFFRPSKTTGSVPQVDPAPLAHLENRGLL